MSKYRLTTEQFKEIIMPFIEDIKKECQDLKILKIEEYTELYVNQDFKIEYTFNDKEYYVIFTICDSGWIWISGFADGERTPLVRYMVANGERIEDALHEYLYKLFGDEYKEYLIELIKNDEQKSMDRAQSEIDSMQARVDEEKSKLEMWQTALIRVKNKKDLTKGDFDKKFEKIENLLNPHQV